MNDLPQVNLIAAIGPGGSLGPKDGLPLFADPEEARIYTHWFLDLCQGGILIIDEPTLQKMVRAGFRGFEDRDMFVWQGQAPEAVLPNLEELGRPMFVVGSEELYRAWMPWVKQFFVRRVEMIGPHETFLPNPFGKQH